MKRALFILVLALGVLGIAIFSTYIARREQLDAKRQAVNSAWAHLDAALQRRADLVPTLVASLHPVSVQERAAFGELTRVQLSVSTARAPIERIAASQQLDSAVARLQAVAEIDPDLRFNDRFFRWQEQLSVAQRRVAVEKQRYDQAVDDYNSSLEEFPDSVFARWSGHRPVSNLFSEAPNVPDSGRNSAPKH